MINKEKVINALGRCESYGYCEDELCPYYRDTGCLEELRQDALALLKEQPEIVLCKDCKHWGTNDCEMRNHWGDDEPTPDEWFCPVGERRDDDA